ncbi:hypothetical protein NDU88_001176 [Pleurodeles waltl]|uniref:Uncharacterized protein n=1 Tax=Pleurodeles waltl TaxID=8319 RepID=A0AAV7NDH4_PLEWA|nr:hypothetical protein NDU88_001176 [Pleurodeles waltl]
MPTLAAAPVPGPVRAQMGADDLALGVSLVHQQRVRASAHLNANVGLIHKVASASTHSGTLKLAAYHSKRALTGPYDSSHQVSTNLQFPITTHIKQNSSYIKSQSGQKLKRNLHRLKPSLERPHICELNADVGVLRKAASAARATPPKASMHSVKGGSLPFEMGYITP